MSNPLPKATPDTEISAAEPRARETGPQPAPAPATVALPPGPSVDPDAGLVRSAAAGDVPAFEELVRRHQNRTYTRIFFMIRDRELAADLSQEVFLKAYLNLGSFRGESLFATWLARIAINMTLHEIERGRAKKRSAKVFSIHAAPEDDKGRSRTIDIADRSNNPVERASQSELKQAVLAAVDELEDEYRLALSLRELHGLSYHEIAKVLDIPMGTVKSKIFRARQILQERLKGFL